MATKKKVVLKQGDLIKIIANKSSHNYQIGNTYRVKSVSIDGTSAQATSLDNKWTGNSLSPEDWEITGLIRDHFAREIANAKQEIKHLESILAWMDETGAHEYDPNEHRVWTALTALENKKLTKVEKMKAIAELLKPN